LGQVEHARVARGHARPRATPAPRRPSLYGGDVAGRRSPQICRFTVAVRLEARIVVFFNQGCWPLSVCHRLWEGRARDAPDIAGIMLGSASAPLWTWPLPTARTSGWSDGAGRLARARWRLPRCRRSRRATRRCRG
jgi:hypothetical protein